MSTVEAMASGLVVFLPWYMRPNFNDGAIYADPEDVRNLIRDYWEDPESLEIQSRRAREVVQERYSASAFDARLNGLLARGEKMLFERKTLDG